jgi:hypothetical protein
MNIRIITAVLAAFLLCGCTDADWDYALTYTGLGQADKNKPPQAGRTDNNQPPQANPVRAEAAPAPVPAEQSAKADEWCQQVAKSARDEAAGNGFDLATQQRTAEAHYRQCLGLSGSVPR